MLFRVSPYHGLPSAEVAGCFFGLLWTELGHIFVFKTKYIVVDADFFQFKCRIPEFSFALFFILLISFSLKNFISLYLNTIWGVYIGTNNK